RHVGRSPACLTTNGGPMHALDLLMLDNEALEDARVIALATAMRAAVDLDELGGFDPRALERLFAGVRALTALGGLPADHPGNVSVGGDPERGLELLREVVEDHLRWWAGQADGEHEVSRAEGVLAALEEAGAERPL